MRTLCADVGVALGCGGHLGRLSRTRVGPFRLEDAVRLEEAGSQHLVSPDRLFSPA